MVWGGGARPAARGWLMAAWCEALAGAGCAQLEGAPQRSSEVTGAVPWVKRSGRRHTELSSP